MHDVDIVLLTFGKDALIATFSEEATLWQALQAAALATMGLAALAYAGGGLSDGGVSLAIGFGGIGAVAATSARRQHRAVFEENLGVLLAEAENLKHRGGA